ncbi:hypothetical protein HLH34_05125 [Gluconacetobacter azotocaptans]|uniref:Uncharacterized protein n=2 Tax=Gluconacetobacter azotocaptans TaxID=142834 RepID=A0A7W4PFW6_9PROT|nr:hypothetical protein [Gluconacetobacter azotocaptans]MBB2189346.1 hypothetical protein [Gluconacetobacter azotocaptans]MBM9401259.1 hypothetical protein [Gluconacetobacter azotocaptans]
MGPASAATLSTDDFKGEASPTYYPGQCGGRFACSRLGVTTGNGSLTVDMTNLLKDGSPAVLDGNVLDEDDDHATYALRTLKSRFTHLDFGVDAFRSKTAPQSTCTVRYRDKAFSSLDCTYYIGNDFGDFEPVQFSFFRRTDAP